VWSMMVWHFVMKSEIMGFLRREGKERDQLQRTTRREGESTATHFDFIHSSTVFISSTSSSLLTLQISVFH